MSAVVNKLGRQQTQSLDLIQLLVVKAKEWVQAAAGAAKCSWAWHHKWSNFAGGHRLASWDST